MGNVTISFDIFRKLCQEIMQFDKIDRNNEKYARPFGNVLKYNAKVQKNRNANHSVSYLSLYPINLTNGSIF